MDYGDATLFAGNDDGYRSWAKANPQGFVVDDLVVRQRVSIASTVITSFQSTPHGGLSETCRRVTGIVPINGHRRRRTLSTLRRLSQPALRDASSPRASRVRRSRVEITAAASAEISPCSGVSDD